MSALLLLLVGATDTLRLTFAEALARAYQNAPEARLAGVTIEQQELERNKVLSEFFPQVTSQGQIMRLSEVTSFSFEPVAGYPIEVTLGDEYVEMLQTEIRLPLWTFGRRYQGWLLAGEAIELTHLDSLERCRGIRLNIAEIYANARSLIQVEVLTSAALDNAARHRSNLEEKFEQGLVSHYQLLQTQTREAELKPELIEVRRQLDNLYAQLNIFLDVGKDTLLEMCFDTMADTVYAIPETTIERTLTNSPAFKKIELGKRMLDRQIKIKEREALPALAVGASYSAQRWPLSDGEWSTGWSYNLSLQAPLHQGYEKYLEVKKLEKEKVKLEIQAEALAAQMESELVQTCNDWEVALAKLEASRAREKEAEELVRIVENRFREGLVSDIDLLDAELGLREARTDRVMAERNLILAREHWLNVVGGYQ